MRGFCFEAIGMTYGSYLVSGQLAYSGTAALAKLRLLLIVATDRAKAS
jgi:hypothetical protein